MTAFLPDVGLRGDFRRTKATTVCNSYNCKILPEVRLSCGLNNFRDMRAIVGAFLWSGLGNVKARRPYIETNGTKLFFLPAFWCRYFRLHTVHYKITNMTTNYYYRQREARYNWPKAGSRGRRDRDRRRWSASLWIGQQEHSDASLQRRTLAARWCRYCSRRVFLLSFSYLCNFCSLP